MAQPIQLKQENGLIHWQPYPFAELARINP